MKKEKIIEELFSCKKCNCKINYKGICEVCYTKLKKYD